MYYGYGRAINPGRAVKELTPGVHKGILAGPSRPLSSSVKEERRGSKRTSGIFIGKNRMGFLLPPPPNHSFPFLIPLSTAPLHTGTTQPPCTAVYSKYSLSLLIYCRELEATLKYGCPQGCRLQMPTIHRNSLHLHVPSCSLRKLFPFLFPKSKENARVRKSPTK